MGRFLGAACEQAFSGKCDSTISQLCRRRCRQRGPKHDFDISGTLPLPGIKPELDMYLRDSAGAADPGALYFVWGEVMTI